MVYKRKLFFIFFALFIFTSCASSPLFKPGKINREGYVKNNQSTNELIKQAILEGKVVVGMSKEEVLASWGKPAKMEKLDTNPNAWWYEKDAEMWSYDKNLLNPFQPQFIVHFKRGRVDNIDEIIK